MRVEPAAGPFVFNVAGLLADPVGSARTHDIEAASVDLPDDLVLSAPIQGTVRLTHESRGILADVALTTALAGECARCLRPVVTPIEARIDEEILPSIDLASGQPVPLEEGGDPEAPRLTDHHELELRPLVVESIHLQEPIAPLCEPDCPGLCPECGERLEPGHVHDDAPIDPRLEALRAFRVDAEDESG